MPPYNRTILFFGKRKCYGWTSLISRSSKNAWVTWLRYTTLPLLRALSTISVVVGLFFTISVAYSLTALFLTGFKTEEKWAPVQSLQYTCTASKVKVYHEEPLCMAFNYLAVLSDVKVVIKNPRTCMKLQKMLNTTNWTIIKCKHNLERMQASVAQTSYWSTCSSFCNKTTKTVCKESLSKEWYMLSSCFPAVKSWKGSHQIDLRPQIQYRGPVWSFQTQWQQCSITWQYERIFVLLCNLYCSTGCLPVCVC